MAKKAFVCIVFGIFFLTEVCATEAIYDFRAIALLLNPSAKNFFIILISPFFNTKLLSINLKMEFNQSNLVS
ncbi:hypothetical protein [Sulfurospirillum deleyianum]|uniref:Uncharacterized protein n=1 Tax=Sulfurospirillum deleyianum (strain ATCC 51133 / DSM 6946 / 5175) TaxID=525898 RepID=D1B0A7_SULD5|nr:hypothetical protein [Sulfurospirillum deleyianum]ACZ11724.1 hypothetical protein Sdel_0689 [Sulfurospirillum deleyianum DSM 6946]